MGSKLTSCSMWAFHTSPRSPHIRAYCRFERRREESPYPSPYTIPGPQLTQPLAMPNGSVVPYCPSRKFLEGLSLSLTLLKYEQPYPRKAAFIHLTTLVLKAFPLSLPICSLLQPRQFHFTDGEARSQELGEYWSWEGSI